MKINRKKSEQLWKKAVQVVPTGSQTFSKAPYQYVNGVAPKYLERGKGSHVWDVDGNEYIDYGAALGPIILGYRYPAVDSAIKAQLKKGISFTLMHPLEVQVAELMTELIPCAEMVRFGKNGSDATAGAIRLARAYTKRDRVVCCGYHGWQDWFIGSTTRSAGVPSAVRELTLSFKYNDIESLYKIFRQYPNQIAAVILEPTTFAPPTNQFLEKVKELACKNGAVLIFDEIITGFRMSLGGAQQYFNVTPDLATFGKALGNGMPISAVVGKREIMRLYEEVFFSFTFGGETLSLAAALGTISELKRTNALSEIWKQGAKLKEGYNEISRELGITSFTRCVGYSCWPEFEFLGSDGKISYPLQTLFIQEIIKRGILTRAGMFINYSHSDNDIKKTLEVMRQALIIVNAAVSEGTVEKKIEGDLIQPVIRATT